MEHISPLQIEQHIKRKFQGQALNSLLHAEAYSHEDVLRRKLKRWGIRTVPEGTLARRASRYIRHAFTLVPTRVAVVLFRTWLNGWCTARRFQVRHATCLFACGLAGECNDSIEHYAFCPVLKKFAIQQLRIPQHLVGTMLGFLCLDRDVDDNMRTLQLLLLYAVYSAANTLRFRHAGSAGISMDALLLQYVNQGASTSSAAQQALYQATVAPYAQRRRIAV